jgi:hypothetical protein
MSGNEKHRTSFFSILNDTEETKVAGPSGPRISTGPAGRSLFSLTGPTVNILATGQRASGYAACVYLDLLPHVKRILTEIYAGNQYFIIQ